MVVKVVEVQEVEREERHNYYASGSTHVGTRIVIQDSAPQ